MISHPLISQFLHDHDIRSSNDVVALVRRVAEIPWGEARTIDEVLTKNRGTCLGKHLVLRECLREIGIPVRDVVCGFQWIDQPIQYPEDIQNILKEGTWEHRHNFLQIDLNGVWIDVDITWDPPLQTFGFKTLPEGWNGTVGFVGVDHITRRFDGIILEEKRKELIDTLTHEEHERCERFLKIFFAWIASIRHK